MKKYRLKSQPSVKRYKSLRSMISDEDGKQHSHHVDSLPLFCSRDQHSLRYLKSSRKSHCGEVFIGLTATTAVEATCERLLRWSH